VAEAGIRSLRDHLSHYLARVREGEELTITDRGKAIAKIVPVSQRGRSTAWSARGSSSRHLRPRVGGRRNASAPANRSAT
jgi:prevent-host-death family protein